MQNTSGVETSFLLKGPAGLLEARVSGLKDISPHTVCIVCHPHPLHLGTMDNKVVTTMVRAFQALGMATIRFNFRGVGKSEGHYGEGVGEVEDLRAIVDWVHEQCLEAKIVLSGFSFGAYVSTRYLTNLKPLDPPIEALFGVAPPINLFDFASKVSFNCPWIILHGSEDELVPVAEVKKWVETIEQTSLGKRAPQLIVIKEASHFFHGQLISLKTQMVEAYQRLTK